MKNFESINSVYNIFGRPFSIGPFNASIFDYILSEYPNGAYLL